MILLIVLKRRNKYEIRFLKKNILKATAVADVKIRLPIPDVWGNDCKIDQILKQGKDSALEILRKYLSDVGVVVDMINIKIILKEEDD